ncbi:hypothetical protein [Glycomyces rhizosphaerae]|uniref:PH domain-containing protein n=1 Tax=Glycomyces rhizosphaerae TaxID=2054422 RepID=A0ABV7PW21_9ACTN
MYPAPTSTPTPDATPVPVGRRIARKWVLFGAAGVALALYGVLKLVTAIINPLRVADPMESIATGAILMLLFPMLAFVCLRHARRRSDLSISTDNAGLWISDGDAHAVVPWNSAAAIGLHEYSLNGATSPAFSYTSWSIELRLHHPIDRDDPLLERFVLPAGPPRYLIRLPRGTHVEAMAAVDARVPELWHGLFGSVA